MQPKLLHALVQTNREWLQQAARLLESLTDEQYATTPPGYAPHIAGGHMRHILDFYDSFLAGVDSGYVDYDARRRDERTSRDRHYAIERMEATAAALARIEAHNVPATLLIRMEDAGEALAANPWMPSSVARELQTLSSHTIHHFALIAFTLRAHGVAVDPAFGMAPSTIRHRQRQAAA